MERSSAADAAGAVARFAVVRIADTTRSPLTTPLSDSDSLGPIYIQEPVVVALDDMADDGFAKARHLTATLMREPLPGEFGCALSHRLVYEWMVEHNVQWALVLEDDAQILDAHMLKDHCAKFVQHHTDPYVPNVLSCFSSLPPGVLFPSGINPSIRRALLPPVSTVAYLINRAAAQQFIYAQTPLQFLADWPETSVKVRYYVLQDFLVKHDPDAESTVDPLRIRQEYSTSMRIQRWSGIWFWRHLTSFRTPFTYIRRMWLPGLNRHLGRVQSRLATGPR